MAFNANKVCVLEQQDCCMRLAEEKDFRKIITFLNKCEPQNANDVQSDSFLSYVNPMLDPESFFNELTVRDNLYCFKEEFILYEEGEQLKGILVLHIPQMSKVTAASVSFFIIPDDDKIILKMFDFASCKLIANAISDITKITFPVMGKGVNKGRLSDVAEKCGLVLELKRQDELGFGNHILSYAKYIL